MKLNELLESALYVADITDAECFYTEVLGLTLDSKAEDRHLFFRCGHRMLLLFNAEATVTAGEGPEDAPQHGTKGAGHIAFAVQDQDLDRWKEHLSENGVAIEKEIEWEGSRSIYFRDPSGNSLEITSPVIWGIPENTFFNELG
jgi:catechol 2,3-dioxygenase-like lactoylglutathione lyase family enzyme